MEAISQAGAVIGVLSKDGIALAAEKKISSKVWCRKGHMYCWVWDRPCPVLVQQRLTCPFEHGTHLQSVTNTASSVSKVFGASNVLCSKFWGLTECQC